MNYLTEIIARKRREIKKRAPSLKSALKGSELKVIGEIKRKSPSKGDLASIESPRQLAERYLEAGVAALSVLTDRVGFGGALSDLEAVTSLEVPVLRKDFIIDEIQIAEAAVAGASAVLLIVAALGKKVAPFLQLSLALGLEALVEVHDEKELMIALEAGAEIIGVNNRNLETFVVDLATAERLGPLIPKDKIKVAESGIKTIEDGERMARAGYDAVLIGEALVTAADPRELIQGVGRCLR